tara:strand:- start:35520 stop:37115 length:1596 start_codon:yes stop_codon:yes gene_type:complete
MSEPTTPVSPEDKAKFEKALEVARVEAAEGPPTERYVDGKLVTWVPQPGSQTRFMSCPFPEALYHGTRGPGKTDALIMDFAQDVGRGYGAAWRGILFRETYPQLADVVAKSERWFRQIFPNATFNRQRMAWEWPTGEVLFFRHMKRPEDYWNYHGHEYPWIGWEELTNWADDRCYRSMFSCNRSSSLPPTARRRIRSTTNPYGVGHGWVKVRYRLHGEWWKTIVIEDGVDDRGNAEPARCAIHGHIDENKVLLESDPNYKQNIRAAAQNEAMADAWEHGSWKLIAGGMFSDVWSFDYNGVPRFRVPKTWRIDRSFDWGSSKPFSVGWWAVSDGSDLLLSDGRMVSTVRGDLFRVKEWYGWSGRPDEGLRMLASEIAEGIVERELLWGWRTSHGNRVSPGVADSAIFKVENGNCIATDMEAPVRVGDVMHHGIRWVPSDKGAGSRTNGWELMRKRLKSSHRHPDGRPRETAGLFIVLDECEQWIRTVLALPRDEKNMDDVDTNAEDHAGDETRYRVRFVGQAVKQGKTSGGY